MPELSGEPLVVRISNSTLNSLSSVNAEAAQLLYGLRAMADSRTALESGTTAPDSWIATPASIAATLDQSPDEQILAASQPIRTSALKSVVSWELQKTRNARGGLIGTLRLQSSLIDSQGARIKMSYPDVLVDLKWTEKARGGEWVVTGWRPL